MEISGKNDRGEGILTGKNRVVENCLLWTGYLGQHQGLMYLILPWAWTRKHYMETQNVTTRYDFFLAWMTHKFISRCGFAQTPLGEHNITLGLRS